MQYLGRIRYVAVSALFFESSGWQFVEWRFLGLPRFHVQSNVAGICLGPWKFVLDMGSSSH